MYLPTLARKKDVQAICKFLLVIPEGADKDEITTALRIGNSRKLTDCEKWGFIENNDQGRYVITERGRNVKGSDGKRKQAYLDAISDFPAYVAIIERAVREGKFTVLATDVSSYWDQHLPPKFVATKNVRRSQVISFFRLLDETALGNMTKGTRGTDTIFEFKEPATRKFLSEFQANQVDASGKSPEGLEKLETNDKQGHVGSVDVNAETPPGRTEASVTIKKESDKTDREPWLQVLAALEKLRADGFERDLARIKENAQLRADIDKLRVESAERDAARIKEIACLRAELDILRVENAERQAAKDKENANLGIENSHS